MGPVAVRRACVTLTLLTIAMDIAVRVYQGGLLPPACRGNPAAVCSFPFNWEVIVGMDVPYMLVANLWGVASTVSQLVVLALHLGAGRFDPDWRGVTAVTLAVSKGSLWGSTSGLWQFGFGLQLVLILLRGGGDWPASGSGEGDAGGSELRRRRRLQHVIRFGAVLPLVSTVLATVSYSLGSSDVAVSFAVSMVDSLGLLAALHANEVLLGLSRRPRAQMTLFQEKLMADFLPRSATEGNTPLVRSVNAESGCGVATATNAQPPLADTAAEWRLLLGPQLRAFAGARALHPLMVTLGGLVAIGSLAQVTQVPFLTSVGFMILLDPTALQPQQPGDGGNQQSGIVSSGMWLRPMCYFISALLSIAYILLARTAVAPRASDRAANPTRSKSDTMIGGAAALLPAPLKILVAKHGLFAVVTLGSLVTLTVSLIAMILHLAEGDLITLSCSVSDTWQNRTTQCTASESTWVEANTAEYAAYAVLIAILAGIAASAASLLSLVGPEWARASLPTDSSFRVLVIIKAYIVVSKCLLLCYTVPDSTFFATLTLLNVCNVALMAGMKIVQVGSTWKEARHMLFVDNNAVPSKRTGRVFFLAFVVGVLWSKSLVVGFIIYAKQFAGANQGHTEGGVCSCDDNGAEFPECRNTPLATSCRAQLPVPEQGSNSGAGTYDPLQFLPAWLLFMASILPLVEATTNELARFIQARRAAMQLSTTIRPDGTSTKSAMRAFRALWIPSILATPYAILSLVSNRDSTVYWLAFSVALSAWTFAFAGSY